MAPSDPHWRTRLVCLVDPLALSPLQAMHSQPQGRRKEEPDKSQRLIGNGHSDWMAEEVDFSEYFPDPHSSPSPNSSLSQSPFRHDIQVPLDLEVMTSLLQEELAQLEDYFLSDALSTKPLKLGKFDKVAPVVGSQSYYQVPYVSYTNYGQSESSPLLVTLATGELDLLSFSGNPTGRSKMPRHTPYGCSRPNSNGRRRFCDGLGFGEAVDNCIWNSKACNSVSSNVAVTRSYCCVDDERSIRKSCSFGDMLEVRKSDILAKEEKSYSYTDVCEKVGGEYSFGEDSSDASQRKEDEVVYGMQDEQKMIYNDSAVAMEVVCENGCSNMAQTAGWKTEIGGSFLHVGGGGTNPNYLGGPDDPVMSQHSRYSNLLEDQSSECLSGGEGEGMDLGSAQHAAVWGLKEDPTGATSSQNVSLAAQHGHQRQKKRDQNKTAAHRYRQRKRAELDSLEDHLHRLESRNRELRDKAESVEREIQYVKDLLIEVYKARSQRLKQDGSP